MKLIDRFIQAYFAFRGEGEGFFTPKIHIDQNLPGYFRQYNYLTYAEEGFQRNPIVYACVNEIMKGCSAVKVKLRLDGEIIEPEKTPPLLIPLRDLLVRPNPNDSFKTFIKEWIQQLMLGGISYIQMINLGKQILGETYERPLQHPELWLYRPDRVEIHSRKRVIDYYRVDDKKNFTPDEMMHIKFPNGVGEFAGMPPMKAAAYCIDTHNQTALYNYQFLKNNGVPAGILTLLGIGRLTKEDRKKAKAEWKREYEGARNAGKTMIVSAAEAKYLPFAASAKDLDWETGDARLMRSICMTLGVPSKLLNDPSSSTYNNVKEATVFFYENTIMPIMEQFGEEFTYSVCKRYADNLEIAFDTSHIKALREDQNEKVKRLVDSHWMTLKEKRNVSNLPDLDDKDLEEKLNVILVPGGLKELGQEMPTQPVTGQFHYVPVDNRTRSFLYHPASMMKDLEERSAFLENIEEKREPHRKKYIRAMQRFWDIQLDMIVSAIENYADLLPENPRGVIPGDLTQGLIYKYDETGRLAEALKDAQRGVIIDFGTYSLEELAAAGVSFDMSRPGLEAFLANDLAVRSTLINNSTANMIRKSLIKGEAQGMGIVGLRDGLREMFERMSKGRAALIANTEVTRGTTMGTQEGYTQGGIEYNEWASPKLGDYREEHAAIDGEIVRVGAPFSTGGTGPGLHGKPEQDCNCHCFLLPVTAADITKSQEIYLN